MNTVAFVVAGAIGLMLAEARLSRANERSLRARGARAPAGDLSGVVAVLYPSVLVLMGAEGMWRAAAAGSAGTAEGPVWFASGALLFAASKALKYWAIRALGDRWTFRVLVLPGVALIRSGPYRYVDHPNYLAVVGELAGAAMMCGAPVCGAVGVAVYAAVLWRRARFEDQVLRRPSSRSHESA
jgi:methyltransferase